MHAQGQPRGPDYNKQLTCITALGSILLWYRISAPGLRCVACRPGPCMLTRFNSLAIARRNQPRQMHVVMMRVMT